MSQTDTLGEIAADGGEQTRLATGSAGLDIVLNGGFPANRLYLVAGDPDRLQQVAWNLPSNAIKFMPKGGASASTSAARGRTSASG